MLRNSLWVLFALSGFFGFAKAQNSSPSLHLRTNNQESGDLLIKTARATIATPKTYFSTKEGACCGFQDLPNKGDISISTIGISPNSALDILNINVVGDEMNRSQRVQIFNILGVKVYDREFPAGKHQLKRSELSRKKKGLYLIKIGKSIKKIILE